MGFIKASTFWLETETEPPSGAKSWSPTCVPSYSCGGLHCYSCLSKCHVPALLTGANLEVDVSIQYLRFFLEDDAELKDIDEKYKKGDLLTGEVKARLIQVFPPSTS